MAQSLLTLTIIALITTSVFWYTDLDLQCAAIFYAPPPAAEPWPYELSPLGRLLYYGTPLSLAVMAVGMVLAWTAKTTHPHWRHYAIYLLLTIAIGPGLLVNLVFKDHWGRPRPRQMQIFGGTKSYLPPLIMGTSPEDKSFPSGHAAVGFSLCSFWFLWRRRPLRAWLAFGLSILLGLALGIGRMAAGAHFLSDILWAGYISFFTALVLHHLILPSDPPKLHIANSSIKPHKMSPVGYVGDTLARDAAHEPHYWPAYYPLLYVGVIPLVLVGALLSFPVHEDINYTPPIAWLPLPTNLQLNIRYADLTILLTKAQSTPLHVSGSIRGFGLPTYRIDNRAHIEIKPSKLVYTLKQRGFFTELHSKILVIIDATLIRHLSVQLQNGNIQVQTTKGLDLPTLNLKTTQGMVLPVKFD